MDYKICFTGNCPSPIPSQWNPGTYDPNHYYYSDGASYDWHQANSFCQGQGMHLVEFTSQVEYDNMEWEMGGTS